MDFYEVWEEVFLPLLSCLAFGLAMGLFLLGL